MSNNKRKFDDKHPELGGEVEITFNDGSPPITVDWPSQEEIDESNKLAEKMVGKLMGLFGDEGDDGVRGSGPSADFEYYATVYYRALKVIAAGGYDSVGPFPPGEKHTDQYIELSREDMMKTAQEAIDHE